MCINKACLREWKRFTGAKLCTDLPPTKGGKTWKCLWFDVGCAYVCVCNMFGFTCAMWWNNLFLLCCSTMKYKRQEERLEINRNIYHEKRLEISEWKSHGISSSHLKRYVQFTLLECKVWHVCVNFNCLVLFSILSHNPIFSPNQFCSRWWWR